MSLTLQLAILAVLIVIAWLSGYHVGVRDTEERWSDAVGRADAHRRAALTGQPGDIIRYSTARCAHCGGMLTALRCESCGAPR